jgi:hypothetical protein
MTKKKEKVFTFTKRQVRHIEAVGRREREKDKVGMLI